MKEFIQIYIQDKLIRIKNFYINNHKILFNYQITIFIIKSCRKQKEYLPMIYMK